MTFELRCVRPKCGKRVSPDSAYRRRVNKGLCICGGALKVTSAHYYGTNPVDEAAPQPAAVATFKGRQVTELTRDELVEAYTRLSRDYTADREAQRQYLELDALLTNSRTEADARS